MARLISDVPLTAEFPWPAPAKINLFLHVTGRRPAQGPQAGYHELESLVVFAQDIAACDRIAVMPADTLTLTLDGPQAGALHDRLPMLALADRLSAAARQPLRHELFEPPQFADRRRVLVQLDQALEYAGAGTGIPHNANRSAIVFICHHWMLPD